MLYYDVHVMILSLMWYTKVPLESSPDVQIRHVDVLVMSHVSFVRLLAWIKRSPGYSNNKSPLQQPYAHARRRYYS